MWKVIQEMQAAGVKPNQVTCRGLSAPFKFDAFFAKRVFSKMHIAQGSILLKNLNGSSPESDINHTWRARSAAGAALALPLWALGLLWALPDRGCS